jgi:ferritin-like metal-binding protein YciE
MKENKKILHKYTSDMMGIERHLLEIVGYQKSDGRMRDYMEAIDIVARIQQTLQNHIRRLEKYVEGLDVDTSESTLKKAGTKVSGMATGFYNLMRQEDSVSRNLRDDYTALHMAAISYTMLHSLALSHHDADLAAISQENLQDITMMAIEMSRVIPAVLIKELSFEGKAPDVTVIEQAIENTQSAWRKS